jgi:hypothetical protein
MDNNTEKRISAKLKRLAKLIDSGKSELDPLSIFTDLGCVIDSADDFEKLLTDAILLSVPEADMSRELEFNRPYRYVSYEGVLGFTWDLSGDIVGNNLISGEKLFVATVVDGDGTIIDLYIVW